MRFAILSVVAAWIVGATSLAIQNTTSLATLNSTIYDETPPPAVDGDHRICIPSGQPNPGLNSTYDCGGSIMCNTVKVVWCDKGINHKLIRNDDLNYGAIGSGKPHFGVCHGQFTDFGCAIIIQGPKHCVRSGNDMWWDYQEIRSHGCHHCGNKHWGDRCSTTIDYWESCRLVW
ncbi:hypothetical protein F4806DRAFT_131310 [Annulohypoxylon nitens]|nr:hypothetical protein F4806DRAFT_131310 [Annulohypoxylon nitens]